MRNRFYLSLVVVALLCMVGWTGYAHGQRSSVGRQIWEYRVDLVPGTKIARPGWDDVGVVARENAATDQVLINQRATEGWELTAVGNSNYYFRRAR
jgi:hypothetical protein